MPHAWHALRAHIRRQSVLRSESSAFYAEQDFTLEHLPLPAMQRASPVQPVTFRRLQVPPRSRHVRFVTKDILVLVLLPVLALLALLDTSAQKPEPYHALHASLEHTTRTPHLARAYRAAQAHISQPQRPLPLMNV